MELISSMAALALNGSAQPHSSQLPAPSTTTGGIRARGMASVSWVVLGSNIPGIVIVGGANRTASSKMVEMASMRADGSSKHGAEQKALEPVGALMRLWPTSSKAPSGDGVIASGKSSARRGCMSTASEGRAKLEFGTWSPSVTFGTRACNVEVTTAIALLSTSVLRLARAARQPSEQKLAPRVPTVERREGTSETTPERASDSEGAASPSPKLAETFRVACTTSNSGRTEAWMSAAVALSPPLLQAHSVCTADIASAVSSGTGTAGSSGYSLRSQEAATSSKRAALSPKAEVQCVEQIAAEPCWDATDASSASPSSAATLSVNSPVPLPGCATRVKRSTSGSLMAPRVSPPHVLSHAQESPELSTGSAFSGLSEPRAIRRASSIARAMVGKQVSLHTPSSPRKTSTVRINWERARKGGAGTSDSTTHVQMPPTRGL
eukprot:scaffold34365_cov27-Tisochrysis_lutea.AAC.2